MAFGESSRPCVHSAEVNGKSNYLRGGVCVFRVASRRFRFFFMRFGYMVGVNEVGSKVDVLSGTMLVINLVIAVCFTEGGAKM